MKSFPVVVSAWVAFLLWVLGEWFLARRRGPVPRWSRSLWLLGAIVLTGHLVVAFALIHGWSHRAAVEATALQTREQMGFGWGGGVFINYLLVAWWWWDVARSWLRPGGWNSPGPARMSRRGFFWFMWFNGAVIFASGLRRGIAALLCLLVLVAWWGVGRRDHSTPASASDPC